MGDMPHQSRTPPRAISTVPFGGHSAWAALGKNQPYHINIEMAAKLLIKMGTSGPPAEDCQPDFT